jgi:hypothetical protein
MQNNYEQRKLVNLGCRTVQEGASWLTQVTYGDDMQVTVSWR